MSKNKICTFNPCGRSALAKGLCRTHYRQQREGKELAEIRTYVDKNSTLRERLEDNIVINDNGCWVWQGTLNEKGYGLLSWEGQVVRAHRMSYQEFVGPLDRELSIDHSCGNRACISPQHLRQLTNKQNIENRVEANVNNTTGYRGVSFHKQTGKYRAYLRHNYVQYHLGLFETAEEANEAVIAKRLELFTHNELDRKN